MVPGICQIDFMEGFLIERKRSDFRCYQCSCMNAQKRANNNDN